MYSCCISCPNKYVGSFSMGLSQSRTNFIRYSRKWDKNSNTKTNSEMRMRIGQLISKTHRRITQLKICLRTYWRSKISYTRIRSSLNSLKKWPNSALIRIIFINKFVSTGSNILLIESEKTKTTSAVSVSIKKIRP